MKKSLRQIIIDALFFEISITKSTNLDNPHWTDDYREGYIDGLSRAIEKINDEDWSL